MATIEHHTTRVPGWPSADSQCITLTIAMRIVRLYGGRLPTVAAIQQDFSVSRATAFRWRAALREAAEKGAI